MTWENTIKLLGPSKRVPHRQVSMNYSGCVQTGANALRLDRQGVICYGKRRILSKINPVKKEPVTSAVFRHKPWRVGCMADRISWALLGFLISFLCFFFLSFFLFGSLFSLPHQYKVLSGQLWWAGASPVLNLWPGQRERRNEAGREGRETVRGSRHSAKCRRVESGSVTKMCPA